MSKFVDVEKLIKALEDEGADIPPEWDGGEWGYSLKSLKKIIGDIDAADVAPVVHAKWVPCFEGWRKQIVGDECTSCGFQHYGTSIAHYHYCPNCGAKMDKED